MRFLGVFVLLYLSVAASPNPERRPRVNNTDPRGALSPNEVESMSLHFAYGKISIPMFLSKSAINTSRRYSYCFKFLFEVPGLQSGLHDGWKVDFIQGYVAIKDKMYLFYRCDEKL